jgi:hypothetical protein
VSEKRCGILTTSAVCKAGMGSTSENWLGSTREAQQ